MPPLMPRMFQCEFGLGSYVRVAPEISALVVSVKFTMGNTVVYTCEWFHNGALQSANFYESQLKRISHSEEGQ